MRRKCLSVELLCAAAVFMVIGLFGIPTVGAVETHHPPATTGDAAAAPESMQAGMMSGSSSASGPGMMGTTGRTDDGGAPGMMGHGMMRMMMAQMTGGPGGMGNMMGSMGPGMMGCGGGPMGMALMARMLEDLKLTPEQWDQVRALARERLDGMVDRWAQQMKVQIELSSLRWDQEIDAQRVKSLFAKRGEAMAEMFLARIDYLRKLKGILTPDQLKKLMEQGL